ncbi:protein pangolin, isoforms A/H/I/S-like [Ostrinia furnacalis]|uniref:protein pangolin, isoforms A/H/I/S-like n=1 Tax=Ostrinia furnacalis TaxID=93504 RepID=UPI00103FAC41|nr:protein pangolin, isoforms A/H/I/S-like [Ostrinia furnacalis]
MKMPHAHSSSAASSGGDDLGSTDEVKVFKDEGDGEDEKRSSENLLEEKSSLIDWTESEEKSGEPYSGKLSVKSDLSPVFGKFEPHPAASFNMGYLMAPYPYPNGGAHPLPVSMVSIHLYLTSHKVDRRVVGSKKAMDADRYQP